MSQVSVSPTTAPGRSSWRALRPLLLLGGFVAIWWALMTGVAQADSAPKHLVDHVRSQVKAHHETQPSPVREAVRRVHHDVKATAAKTTSHVRQQSTPVTQKVTAVVRSTPAAPISEPVVSAVTKTVRSTVSETVAKTRSLLAKTPADPIVDTVEKTVKNAESSTVQGDSPLTQHSASPSVTSTIPVTATVTTELVASAAGDQASAAPSGKRASDDVDAPVDGPRGTPPVHDPCASPSGSSTTSITPVGVVESSMLAMPQVVHDLHVGRLARLLDGPAYEPGSSPD